MKIYVKAFLILLVVFPQALVAQPKTAVPNGAIQREYQVKVLRKIADPVLIALSKNELKKNMPVEAKVAKDRVYSTYLEAFGRLLAGIAPWLELGPDQTEEGKLRKRYIDLSVACIKNATDPQGADFMNFNVGRQPLVDAAFFAQALIRSPKQLWGNLDVKTQKNVLDALKSSRIIQPSYTNWLMFSATVEAAIEKFDHSGDKMRMDYAIKQHLLWYKGDGIYGDGPNFHWDYYNSFVIQPMLVDVLSVLKAANLDPKDEYSVIMGRSQRWAAVQERLISPEGTYPPLGRSLAYRFGAFQSLAQMSLMKALPKPISPAQVRYAMYTLIKKQIEAPGTFDDQGWLRIGFYGHQPNLGENYISTGSLYLIAQGLLALGLPASDEYWQAPNVDWTAKRVWNGEIIEIDHAYKD